MVFWLGNIECRLNQIPSFSMICTTKTHVKIVLEQTCALYFKMLNIKKNDKMFVCCKIAGFNSFTYIKVKSYINNQWIISDSFWKWSLLVQKTSLNRNYESQAENNESIFYFAKNMNIKQEAKCHQWDLSECLCFSITTMVCFKFLISVLITMKLFFGF